MKKKETKNHFDVAALVLGIAFTIIPFAVVYLPGDNAYGLSAIFGRGLLTVPVGIAAYCLAYYIYNKTKGKRDYVRFLVPSLSAFVYYKLVVWLAFAHAIAKL